MRLRCAVYLLLLGGLAVRGWGQTLTTFALQPDTFTITDRLKTCDTATTPSPPTLTADGALSFTLSVPSCSPSGYGGTTGTVSLTFPTTLQGTLGPDEVLSGPLTVTSGSFSGTVSGSVLSAGNYPPFTLGFSISTDGSNPFCSAYQPVAINSQGPVTGMATLSGCSNSFAAVATNAGFDLFFYATVGVEFAGSVSYFVGGGSGGCSNAVPAAGLAALIEPARAGCQAPASTMEAVQVMQSFPIDTPTYSLPLIAGKSTIVRMYAIGTSLPAGSSVTGSITVAQGNNTLGTLQPIQNEEFVLGQIERNMLDDSLDFLIPPDWTTQGDLTITGQFANLAGFSLTLPNNPAPITLHFQPQAKTPFIVNYMEWCMVTRDSPQTPVCPSDMPGGLDRMADAPWLLRRLYPAADNGIVYRPLLLAPSLTWKRGMLNKGEDNIFIANLRRWYMLLRSLGNVADQLYAWVPVNASPDAGGDSDPIWNNPHPDFHTNSTGFASIGHSAFSQTYPVDQNLMAPGYGAATMAHEIGHNLGLRHTNTGDSGGAVDANSCYPYQSSHIQNAGYDSIDKLLVPNTDWDVMSYVDASSSAPIWLAPYTYDILVRGRFQPQDDSINLNSGHPAPPNWNADLGKCEAPSASPSPNVTTTAPAANAAVPSQPAAASDAVDSIVISGTISQAGSATLNPSYRVQTTATLDQSDPNGAYCIQFNGVAGALSTFCFSLGFTSVEAGPITTDAFAFQIPFPAQTTSIALLSGGTQLASNPVPQTAPSVSITSPKAGDQWNPGPQTITWTASEAGGAALTFLLLYSADGGNTYVPLDFDLTDTQFTLDTSSIQGGSQVFFQVMASDGVNTTTATVGPVTVNQTPKLAAAAPSFNIGNATSSSSASGQVTLASTGTGPLTVSSASVDNGAFTIVDPPMPLIIPAGRQASLTVQLGASGSAQGTQSGKVTVVSNDPSGPLQVPITGTIFANPTPNSAVSPSSLTFTAASGQSVTQNLAITNSGSANLKVSSISISGTGFSLVNVQTPFTVASNSVQTVTVSFTAPATGPQTGTLTVTTNDPTTPTRTVSLLGTVIPGTSGAGPSFTAAGVVNAASFQAGSVAPGELVTIFGSNFGPSHLATLQVSNGYLTTNVGDTQVLFNGVAAPMIYSVAGQVAAIVPYDVAGKSTAQMQVLYNSVASNTATLKVSGASPALFTANSSGRGPGAILNQDYSVNSGSNPAAAETIVQLFGTGEGQTTPGGVNGKLTVAPYPVPVLPVSVTIGGLNAPIAFVGEAPGLVAGVFQIDAMVPANAPAGNLPVVVTVGNTSSPGGVTVAVKGTAAAQAPTIGVAPTSLALGSVTVGQSANVTLNVSNTGTAALNVSAIASSSAAVRIASPAVPFTVQPGASTPLTVKFTPTAAGAVSGSLTLTSNDPVNEQIVVPFSGMGLAAVSGGSITATSNNGTGPYNLTPIGSTDWVHWGLLGTTTKALGGGQIGPLGELTILGNFTNAAYGNTDPRTLTWSDGSPQASNTGDNSGDHNYGNPGNGYSFSAPASNTSSSTLVVFLSGTAGTGTFTAHLSDNSAPDFTQNVTFGALQDVNFTVTYQSGTPNATLTITWVTEANPGSGNAEMNISAAALSVGGSTGTGTGTASAPVAWWKFDEGSGTAVSDSSGNGDSGTLTGGVTWTTGEFGSAVLLDGVTGYIQGSSPGTGFPLGSAARTISAWVKVASAPTADNAILHYGTGSGAPPASNFHLYMTGSPAGHIGLGNGYGFGTITSVKNVADGNWHLVVGEYDGDASVGGDGLLHIYIDGVLDSSGAPSTTPATGALSNWRIGQFLASGTPFHGALDDVRVYARALSASDIQSLLTGAATGPSGGGTPTISVPATTLQLGSITVGQSATVPFNISNTGTAALTVSSIASSNAAVTITAPSIPLTVQPGAATPVSLRYAPTAPGVVNGSLTITSDDPAHGEIMVSFTGTALAVAGTPTIGASTTSLAFGNVAVGQISTMTFNVLNTGSAALTVSSVVISSPVFGLMTPTIPFTAQPGSVTPVTVVFAPQAAGAQSATFMVTSNDPSHPEVSVTLTGTGTGAPDNLLAYSNVVVGQSESGTLTLTNTGTTPLTVTAQTTTDPAFTVSSPSTPYSIPAGQSVPITIVFTPTQYTVYNATLSLMTSGGMLTTPLSGAGVVVQ